jgi:hypothetical protein
MPAGSKTRLNAAHQGQLRRGAAVVQVGLLEQPDAVLGGNAAAVARHDLEDPSLTSPAALLEFVLARSSGLRILRCTLPSPICPNQMISNSG